MNIFIEYCGLKKIKQIIRKTANLGGDAENNYTIIFYKKVPWLTIYYLLNHLKNGNRLEIVCELSSISHIKLKYFLSSKRIKSSFILMKEITIGKLYLLQNAKKIVKLVDCFGTNQLQNVKNVVVNDVTKGENEWLDSDIKRWCYGLNPIFQCEFSSCLGKNIVFYKDERIGICPIHKDKGILGNFEEIDNIFETKQFETILINAIEQRAQCQNACEIFSLCRGGCALVGKCEYYKAQYSRALQEKENIIKQKQSLDDVSLETVLAIVQSKFIH